MRVTPSSRNYDPAQRSFPFSPTSSDTLGACHQKPISLLEISPFFAGLPLYTPQGSVSWVTEADIAINDPSAMCSRSRIVALTPKQQYGSTTQWPESTT